MDGNFGVLGNVLKTSVNNGGNIVDAQTCMDAYEKSSGIAGTTVAVFNPVREAIVETKKSLSVSLKPYYHIKKEGNSL